MADLACELVNGDGEYNLRAVNSIGVDPNYKQMFNHMNSRAWIQILWLQCINNQPPVWWSHLAHNRFQPRWSWNHSQARPWQSPCQRLQCHCLRALLLRCHGLISMSACWSSCPNDTIWKPSLVAWKRRNKINNQSPHHCKRKSINKFCAKTSLH